MKLVLTLGLFCFLPPLFAQPVVDGSNFTTASSVLFFENASPAWLSGLELEDASGPNQTWDYSDFQSTGEQVETFIDVSDTPFLYQIYFNNTFLYPNTVASHALSLGADAPDIELPLSITEAYSFFRNDETGYYIVGSAFSLEGLPIATPYDTTDKVFGFPMEYGDMDSTRSYFLSEVPFLGTFGQSARRYTHADAWGSLITPDSTYTVLRVRAERYITDTLFIEQLGVGQTIERPVQVDYAFLSPGADGPIFEATLIGGVVVSARIRGAGNPLSTIVFDPGADLVLYPNPASNVFRITGVEGPGEIRILTSKGDVLHKSAVNFTNAEINIEGLPNGVYIAAISASQGRFLKRLVIAR